VVLLPHFAEIRAVKYKFTFTEGDFLGLLAGLWIASGGAAPSADGGLSGTMLGAPAPAKAARE
jgi:hypothetical protein